MADIIKKRIDQFPTVTPDGTEYVLVQKQSDLTYGKTTLATASANAAPVQSVAGRTGAVTLTKADVALSNVDNTSDAAKPVSTATQTALNLKANTSSLATVATTGSYTDLSNKPTIPTVTGTNTGDETATTIRTKLGITTLSGSNTGDQDLSAYATTAALAAKANTSSLATVATTGAYADLTGKPTIPTVPTTVSSFTNDAGYTTTTALNTAVANLVNSSPAALDTLKELADAIGDDANFSTTVTSSIATKAPMLNPTAVKTANYTASANDFVPVDTTSGAVTITLPSAPPNGTRFGVKMVIQGGTNAVTVTRGGTDVFNKTGGNTSVTVSLLNQGVQFQYYNGIWYGVAADIGLTALDARYAPITGIPESSVTNLTTDLSTINGNISTNTTAIANKSTKGFAIAMACAL